MSWLAGGTALTATAKNTVRLTACQARCHAHPLWSAVAAGGAEFAEIGEQFRLGEKQVAGARRAAFHLPAGQRGEVADAGGGGDVHGVEADGEQREVGEHPGHAAIAIGNGVDAGEAGVQPDLRLDGIVRAVAAAV